MDSSLHLWVEFWGQTLEGNMDDGEGRAEVVWARRYKLQAVGVKLRRVGLQAFVVVADELLVWSVGGE